MVSTRRSSKANKEDEVVKSPKSPASAKKSKKKQRKEELKSKNTGVGLKIDDKTPSQNKKIVFGEDNLPDADHVEESTKEEVKESEVSPAKDEEDDDDDDAVEEVKGEMARQEVLEQLDLEEKGALKTKKKKKRKEKVVESVEEEDDLDDEFFAQLEVAKAEQAKLEKEKEQLKMPQGKKTTFVFQESEESAEATAPKRVGHNIQVVVLPDQNKVMDDAITSIPTNALSDEALLYSRSEIVDGSDRGAENPNKRKRPNRPDTSWKRSRKMAYMTKGRAKKVGTGRPAPNFVKNR